MPRIKQDSLEKDLETFQQEFDNTIPEDQKEVLTKVKDIIAAIDEGENDKGFLSWHPERLINAREKLARYSEFLGEWIVVHETKSDFAYIWRKGKTASDWQPAKTALQTALKESAKVTNVEVENVLTERYMKEQYYSMFHRRRADLLTYYLSSSDKIIRTIDHRLREVERQRALPQDSSLQWMKPN